MRYLGIVLVLLLSGCASAGTGATWYNPLTWGKHRPADNVDRANVKQEKARNEAIKAAHQNVYQTSVALREAPDSRPVATATDFNATALALLDQAEGSIGVADIERLKGTVTGLLSENAQIRAEAEKQRKKQQESIVDISEKLAKAEAVSSTANAKLRAAYDRENALANEYRNLSFMFYAACGLAVLLGVAWLYVRIALGGIPNAMGKALSVLRVKNPSAADEVTTLLDGLLNRNEQTQIRKATL